LPRCNSWAGPTTTSSKRAKFIAIVPPDEADAARAALQGHRLGRDAVKIGDIREEPPGIVVLLTPIGGRRIVDMLVGDPLPRIC
jgi:hydrogenase expression/formation protein HypE